MNQSSKFVFSEPLPLYLCGIMIKFIFYGLAIYLLYKFVFDLVVPVSKASAQMKEKLQEMQEQQRFQQEQAKADPIQKNAPKTSVDKDYIEFEDLKS